MRKFALVPVMVLLLVVLMGDVNLQTTLPASPDLSSTIINFGQFGLLVYLLIRAEARQFEQQKAWREERRWMVELLTKQHFPHGGQGT